MRSLPIPSAYRPLRTQRGAAALMATVFLLLAITLLGTIGLRLSGTDIIDTAQQNDSVEALFLAESGTERALQRLAAGTSCATLAEPGTLFTLGRGDFEIQTSVDNALTGWCDVSIVGRFLLAGSPTAQRQIDVSLQQAGGIGAWAVGNGGAIYAWSGSSWSAVTSPTGARLNAAYCVSASECWAVGNGGVILHWTGSNWTSVPSGTGEALQGVACIPNNPSVCYAVGNDTVRYWNGSNWAFAWLIGGGNLTGVSCTATTCYAVRDDGRIYQNLFGVWVSFVNFSGDNWNAISCLPSGECWAAGDRSSNNYRFASLVSGSWSTHSFNNTPAKNLYGIHCTASDTCWAVGQPHGPDDKIIRRSGTFTAVEVSGGNDLRAIDCASATDCLAVGNNGAVQHWNGSAWSQATTGMPSVNLYGVAMTGAAGGGGGVQLMRWQEHIP